MSRLEIICHILQSLDGNIDGDFFAMSELRPAFQAFARIRDEYACDAVISGATTAAEIYAGDTFGGLPEMTETYDRSDWQAAKADKYAVIIDGQGTVYWQSGTVERRGSKMHVVTVLQENISDSYIAHLHQAGVSYVFAGTDSLDLPLAVRKLKEQFGIKKMLLSGGGIVDWAFLQAGLIDEISLVIPPVIDGGTGLASAFDDSPFSVGHNAAPLALKDVQRLNENCLWLRYIPVRKSMTK
ncbi:MAG: RibD family protein [Clostridia bacterium]|nr:RibD family protein [Clostridia bacterium]